MSKAAMLNVLEDLEHAKSEVDEERAKDEAILASIGDGMIATDPQGKIIKANKQAEVMLGVKAADMLGKTFSVVMAHEDEDGNAVPPEQSPIPLSLARGKKVLAIAYFVRKDGTRFPAAITVSPIVRENKIMGAIEIFRDISKEKEIDRMKTEFISLASHELRTPLTVIREGVSLVIDEILGPTTAEQKSFLSMALKDIDRLGRIINNLLDVSKIEAGKMEMKRVHVNLSDIAAGVAEAFAQHAKSKKLELKTRFPKKPVEMYVDKDKIVQVFTNLVGNAMKFTEQGSVEISIEDGEDMIICSVRDTGRGISEQDMERVFRKFQQFGGAASSGEKGTGLGLSIAKGIVEMHHGRIGVESIPGQGTRFFFSLPKDTPQKLFQDQLTRELRAAMNERSALCVVSFTLRDLRFGESAGSAREKTAGALLEDVIRAVTHSQADQVLREGESVFAVFSGADKKEIEKIASKIRTEFASALENAGKKGAKAGLDFRIANYPEDGATGEELLSLLSAA
jgi:PAS domain S-box-containing protein